MTERLALVTGAASGMGRLYATRLAAAGWRVAALDLNEEELKSLAEGSNKIFAYPCDVADTAAVGQTIERISNDHGPIHRLAHAAAIMPGGSLEEMPADKINRLMAINYGGTVNLTKAVLPQMLERRAGEMIIFGSVAGVAPSSYLGAYCATKSAVNAYAEVLMHENAGSGIKFLLVCPPAVATPLIDQAMESGPPILQRQARASKMLPPGKVIDSIERALQSGKRIIYPGEAYFAQLFRRAAPGLLWTVLEKSNRRSR